MFVFVLSKSELCPVPANVCVRFHRFWKPVSPVAAADGSNREHSGSRLETQLEGGTVARVKSAVAYSQFFCKETFFESSICLTPFLQELNPECLHFSSFCPL